MEIETERQRGEMGRWRAMEVRDTQIFTTRVYAFKIIWLQAIKQNNAM